MPNIIHVREFIPLTLRSKVKVIWSKVIYRSWMYAIHPIILIHPYARYGMHMSKNKEVMALRHESTHTDGQTNRVHGTSSHGDASMCQIQDAYGKEQRSYGPDTNSC